MQTIYFENEFQYFNDEVTFDMQLRKRRHSLIELEDIEDDQSGYKRVCSVSATYGLSGEGPSSY